MGRRSSKSEAPAESPPPEKKRRLPLPPFLLGGSGPTLMMIAITCSVAAIGGIMLWNQVGDRVMQSEEYRLNPAMITITQPPEWIRADILTEVVRSGSLDQGVSLLDDGAAQQIAAAFALHPWVKSVTRVTKEYPARVDVELVYRKPVAMIKLEGVGSLDLIPIDEEGVRLPEDDFAPLARRRFPRITGVAALPAVGTKAVDPIVIGGARIATVLSEVWEKLGLARISPYEADAATAEIGRPTFEIVTIGNSHILWGPAPGTSPADTNASQAKREKLGDVFERHGSLEGASTHGLDLRNVKTSEHTAKRVAAPPLR